MILLLKSLIKYHQGITKVSSYLNSMPVKCPKYGSMHNASYCYS